jgi:secreted PhoX family phosphatase
MRIQPAEHASETFGCNDASSFSNTPGGIMKLKPVVIAISCALSGLALAGQAVADADHGYNHAVVKSVEFIGMDAPATAAEKADIYTKAQVKVTYRNGKTKTYNLKYHQLMATTDVINGKTVGGLFDVKGDPITDALGQITSDAPDGNSLMVVPGMRPDGNWHGDHALALVTHYEYRGLPPAGETGDFWSKLPATMSLARIDQDKRTGALEVTDYDNIDFSKVEGLWIPCAASLSPWNTHLGSEEYEPDAKTREGLSAAPGSQDGTDINSFSSYFFGDAATANAYRYGLVPEITVKRDGTTAVEKHYALGRFARELADVQPDGKTVYMGDDGAYTGLFMFVADKKGDLSEGTLYAGKWMQTSAVGTDGGTADLAWTKLGHASDKQIKQMVDGGIKFSDIFDVSNTDPVDPTYTKVQTYMGTEWLRLKPGMEKAAAFLETRRYAALLGATTEFNKMEGVTHNAEDKKAYIVISRVENGMSDASGDIQVKTNKGGAIYELALNRKVRDADGDPIKSDYVATSMASIPELLGSYSSTADASGNKCVQERVCGGDNLKYSEAMRTLFIGEDTSYRNNNYVWAFNVDSRTLSRILSVPMGAEATGLQAVDNYNGFAYIMSNFQHPGEFGSSDPDWASIEPLLNSNWNNRLKTAIGYIGTEDGALPAFK